MAFLPHSFSLPPLFSEETKMFRPTKPAEVAGSLLQGRAAHHISLSTPGRGKPSALARLWVSIPASGGKHFS